MGCLCTIVPVLPNYRINLIQCFEKAEQIKCTTKHYQILVSSNCSTFLCMSSKVRESFKVGNRTLNQSYYGMWIINWISDVSLMFCKWIMSYCHLILEWTGQILSNNTEKKRTSKTLPSFLAKIAVKQRKCKNVLCVIIWFNASEGTCPVKIILSQFYYRLALCHTCLSVFRHCLSISCSVNWHQRDSVKGVRCQSSQEGVGCACRHCFLSLTTNKTN